MIFTFVPKTKICPEILYIETDENNKIVEIEFQGGCAVSHMVISRLCAGRTAAEVLDLLGDDVPCGSRQYSCQMFLKDSLREIALDH